MLERWVGARGDSRTASIRLGRRRRRDDDGVSEELHHNFVTSLSHSFPFLLSPIPNTVPIITCHHIFPSCHPPSSIAFLSSIPPTTIRQRKRVACSTYLTGHDIYLNLTRRYNPILAQHLFLARSRNLSILPAVHRTADCRAWDSPHLSPPPQPTIPSIAQPRSLARQWPSGGTALCLLACLPTCSSCHRTIDDARMSSPRSTDPRLASLSPPCKRRVRSSPRRSPGSRHPSLARSAALTAPAHTTCPETDHGRANHRGLGPSATGDAAPSANRAGD